MTPFRTFYIEWRTCQYNTATTCLANSDLNYEIVFQEGVADFSIVYGTSGHSRRHRGGHRHPGRVWDCNPVAVQPRVPDQHAADLQHNRVPDANTEPDSDGDCHRDGHGYANADRDRDGYGDSDSHGDRDSNSDCDSNRNGYTYTDRDSDSDGNVNSNSNSNGNVSIRGQLRRASWQWLVLQ